jgi:hypothetical protein
MDFISLAESAWQLHRRLSGEDDDFANLSGGGESTASSTGSTHTMGASSYMQDASESLSGASQARPLLSPSAEAELFLLASNFLLCK